MRELHAGVLRLELFHLLGVAQRVEGELVDDAGLLGVHDVVDVVVGARQQPSAGAQHAEALTPDGEDLLHVAVGYRVEDEVELAIIERQALRHVRADNADVVALALGHSPLALYLQRRVVEHRALRAACRENGHLLTAAARQAEDPLALQVAEPCVGHWLCGREEDVPLARECALVHLVGDGLSPFPALLHPAVDRLRVDVLVGHALACLLVVLGHEGYLALACGRCLSMADRGLVRMPLG